MIYKFKSQAAADLLMTQPVGDRVLSLIGKGPSAKGIIEVEQIPSALQALEAAVEAENPRPANDNDDDEDAVQHGFKSPDHVTLRQRVWPMVEMLKLARDEKQPIVWGV